MEESSAPEGRQPASDQVMKWTDEMNLAEFPIAIVGDRVPSGVKTLTFEDVIKDRGKPVRRRLTVSGSDKYGLPTSLDDEVILGLIQLTKEAGYLDRNVEFTRYQLIGMLNWRDEGKSYRRLEQSLRRWMGVTLYYDNAWWDKANLQWVNECFHILDHLKIHKGDALNGGYARSSFCWNEIVYRSFHAGNLKKLDMTLYSRISTPTGKRLFRYLDKRFYLNAKFEMDLRKFAEEHVGIRRGYDLGQLKRRLRPALQELQRLEFLGPADDWYVPIRRGICNFVAFKGPKAYCKDEKRTKLDPQSQQLVDRGVTQSEAVRICRRHKPERIQEQIAAFDRLMNSGGQHAPQNPPGFLVSAIKKNYALTVPSKRREPKRPRQQPELPESICNLGRDADDTLLDQFVARLTDEQRRQFEDKALKTAKPFHLKAQERAIKSGNADRIADCRRAILLSHFRTMRKTKSSRNTQKTCAA